MSIIKNMMQYKQDLLNEKYSVRRMYINNMANKHMLKEQKDIILLKKAEKNAKLEASVPNEREQACLCQDA